MESSYRRKGMLLALLSAAVLAGCGGAVPTGAKQISHVHAITTLYFRATSTLGRAPASEQEFKEAINQGKVDLRVLGVGNIDELFVSDRDGLPIVIVYGKDKGKTPDVVAYEQTGVEGVRLVGNRAGQVTEVDAAEFAKLVPVS
jgi:hypothetical protein